MSISKALNAFPGPCALSLEDSGHFYGRSRETKDLIDLSSAYRDVVVCGGSGVGKSSVVGAGVVPGLLKTGARVICARICRTGSVRIPGPTSVQVALQYDLCQPADAFHSRGDTRASAEIIVWPRVRDAWMNPLDELLGQPSERRTYFVFDQCEVLFAEEQPSDTDARVHFFDTVRSLYGQFWALHCIFVVTDQYVSAMEGFADFVPNGFGIRYALAPFSKDTAFQIIQAGFHYAGLSVSADLCVAIVDRLASTNGALGNNNLSAEVDPLYLQMACRTLLEDVGTSRELTFVQVRAFGPADELLHTFYDRLVAGSRIGSSSRAAVAWSSREATIRLWFEHDLIAAGSSRRLVPRTSANARRVSSKVLAGLVRANLIRSVWISDLEWYEVAHERMIPPIRAANAAWAGQRARTRRLYLTMLLILVLAVVLSALQRTVARTRLLENRKRPNALIAEKASEALDQHKYNIAALWADYGIELYRADADRIQKELDQAHQQEPPVGSVSDDERVMILRRGVLNDAALCYYIRGRVSEAEGDRQMAIRLYRAASQYSYARSLDLHGWFWSPAKEAMNRLAALR